MKREIASNRHPDKGRTFPEREMLISVGTCLLGILRSGVNTQHPYYPLAIRIVQEHHRRERI